MRVFVHEFITSGALTGQELPSSLLAEGLAMRDAVIADFAAIPGVTVCTTLDARVPMEGEVRGEVVEAVSRDEELRQFQALCQRSDFVVVIAPELDGELCRRVDLANRCARGRVLNSIDLVRIASDKWQTFQRLTAAGIPTPATCLASSGEWRGWQRAVFKPRDGAGCQGIRFVPHVLDSTTPLPNDIVQPWLTGRWLSCTLLIRPDGSCDAFPPAEQHFTTEGPLAYLGGAMPAAGIDESRLHSLAKQAIAALVDDDRRLIGPVGVDFLEMPNGEVLVVEVNPRFTTSYVAARRLTRQNLLAPLLDARSPGIEWLDDHVRFTAEGDVKVLRADADGQ